MASDIPGIPPIPPPVTGETAQGGAADRGRNTSDGPAATTTADTVTLTPQASRLKRIESGLGAQSVIDSARVEQLRSAIDAGRYEINPLRVAEKFIQFETSIDNGLKANP